MGASHVGHPVRRPRRPHRLRLVCAALPRSRCAFSIRGVGRHASVRRRRLRHARGTFTHDGGGCSFETLIAKTGTPDAALRRIAEIVHAIDLKDGKYDRPETAGVGQLLAGIVAAHADDATRLERGATLFDDLYRAFQDKPRVTMPKGLRVPRRPT